MIRKVIKIIPDGLTTSIYRLKIKIFNTDDYKWSEYSKEYSREISEIEKKHTLILPDNDYSIIEGKIVLNPSYLPLHNNHKLLYETIYDLKPRSLLEIGCGCGDHLLNIKKLLCNTQINGCDISENQIEFLRARHTELNANLFAHDITLSPPDIKVDLVYTQAVIMHIQKNDHHLNALRNIFRISNKYIILMENWERHNFYNDIIKISKEPDFPWKNMYMYVNDDGHQILMIISNTILGDYHELHTNKELLRYLAK